MKKHVTIAMMAFSIIMFSQKKKNGTIYLEHPSITAVEAMQQAFIKGDTTKLSTYLADNFRAINGMNTNPEAKGTPKKAFLNQSLFWKNNTSYLSIERTPGAYPDALEYADSKGEVWVQTWDDLKGVHDDTGVKLNMPLHRLFFVNKDNKIVTMITYNDGTVFQTLREGFSERKNGTLYNSHKYINKVRRMMAAFENMDLEKAYSYFDEKASFNNLEMAVGESMTLEELKAAHQEFYKKYEIESIDVVGYPDGLDYEIGGGGMTIQSWWNFRVIRKSDKKKLVMPAMYTHDFNDEGMIVRSIGYFSTKVLDSK
ncbi:nuclear transport factor 2 family protein [Sabulilitoribacter multivorans]|uniref:Nuclear transport factor 2 family protein n=1 Tax=Flaviramulus multivorans TaxID=1304750 RepID=A0ABS9IJW1_9FLAO|nr:nuclear transport factor 2 family protein [Flaviramulus multivorans]MCF7560876.1 nuclear transport factor 2 family protein [Flaviramulus multivorans]